MPHYVALLRALNVGGARTVRMETLRRAFEPLGFSSVSTFIASGNVLFESPSRNIASLEAAIEERLLSALGFDVTTFVRSDEQLAAIAAYRAFPDAMIVATSELGIVFLAAPVNARTGQRLKAVSTETDRFHAHGREVYWLRRRGPGLTYSTVPLDRVLVEPFTIRSFRTIQKLVDKLCP